MKPAKTLLIAALIASGGLAFAGGDHASGHGHEGEDIGKPGVVSKVSRTVTVDMIDAMRFAPNALTVKQGETVRFIVKNSGKVKHEFVLGTEDEHKRHYAQMMKFPEMEHADANMVSVAPGKSGDVIWQFTKAGRIDFACLHPGHYDAGMKGGIEVVALNRGTR